MARPKKQINRKTDIINAAQLLFTEKGFEKATIDDIAKNIGIGKGTVYLDFKNKHNILRAIIERNANILFEKIELQVKNAKPPYLELLRQIHENHVINVFDMATSQVHTYIALLHTSYQIKQELNYLILKWRNIIAILLENAANNGEIKPCNDYVDLAHLISITLQCFYPPYDLKYSLDHRVDLTKQEIRALLFDDASTIIEVILTGLKVQKSS